MHPIHSLNIFEHYHKILGHVLLTFTFFLVYNNRAKIANFTNYSNMCIQVFSNLQYAGV